MSRIYEALQKAEAERGSDQAGQIPDHSQDRSEQRAARISTHLSATALADFDIPRSSFDELEPTAPESSNTPAVDLDAVAVRPWSPSAPQLPALQERGPAVEQFRSLRSRLYELREARPLKTVLVTSGLPQEGKSFVATNLAISLARNKSGKVLLIDGDMRRYTVHQLLGCESEPGLADYLAGRVSLHDVMQRNEPSITTTPGAQPTNSLPPLTFIAGGNGGDRAADLSNNNRFDELIQAVAPLFDWIIVDSSPVLPVSDAVNLSRACDGVLLVARGGITDFEDLQRTQAELKAAHILGVVLNAVAYAPQAGSYYGYNREQEGE